MSWIPLERLPVDPARHGHKATQLARLREAGLPVPEGWVLPIGAAEDEQSRGRLARALLDLSPTTPRWLLRSSSPHEDRPGGSAAGLFLSRSCAAVPESLALGLEAVLRSGTDEAVRQLLDLPGEGAARLAVLAQPHLALQGWWTAEGREAGRRILLEGWLQERSGPSPMLLELGAEAPEEARLTPVVELIRQTLAFAGEGAWLLELGLSDSGVWLFQLRPAPSRPIASRAREITEAPVDRERDDLPRFPLHARDLQREWAWDREHSPTPLCPLLAGIFARWLRRRPADWPSRLIHGRWHDAVEPRPESPAPPWPTPPFVTAALADWTRHLRPRLQEALRDLDRRTRRLPAEPTGWEEFVEAWLCFQERYYDGTLSGLRRWARRVVGSLAALDPPVPPAPLPDTSGARRDRELSELAELLQRHPERPPATAEALERWLADHDDDPLTLRVRAHLERHGHLATVPWDGRGVPLWEDPWPLWRELARRWVDPPSRAVPSPWPPPALPPEVEASARDAAQVFALCEDDDVLLSQAYALFRRAAHAVAGALALTPRAADEVVDLLPGDLEGLIREPDPERWRRARDRGRALAMAWTATEPSAESPREGTLRGIGVSPGRARGRLRRLAGARQEGGPAGGEILVVPNIVPADAIVFPRLAGLICEAADVLGHATVLAREHGVPAVVGLSDARRRLARQERVFLDGERGEVVPLAEEPPNDGLAPDPGSA